MARYVNASKAVEEVKKLSKICSFEELSVLMMAMDAICEIPTEDSVEIVRCKDCRYCVGLFSCNKNEEQLRRCQRFGLNLIDGNGYCSWGET